MKTYLLIAGHHYYPQPHTYDWIRCYSTYEEAEKEVAKIQKDDYVEFYMIAGVKYDWFKIVDLKDWMF